MPDTICALLVLLTAVLALTASGVRWMVRGAERYARVEADGGSALLGSGVMNMAYWALQPVATCCIAVGITANAVTTISLVLGLFAGIAVAFGALGVGALLAMISSVGDAVDGLVARRTGATSDAGEVFDASVDRYVEFFFLGGLALHYASVPWAQALALFGLVGSFMMSYASAKAEALRVLAPRGMMRRAERATYLTVGAALTPLIGDIRGVTPLIVALVLVAVVANVSAVSRLRCIARAGRGRGLAAVPPLRALPLREDG